MNQEKIGKKIKELRLSKNLSQQEFGSLYGVTYQAVSKWENGKNIPDIVTLKKICEDNNMNIDELLGNKVVKDEKKHKIKLRYFVAFGIILLISIILLIIFLSPSKREFEFKTLNSSCKDFNLYGSMAYSHNKSSIYISNITYCGDKDDTLYKKITCTLFETVDNIDVKINSFDYEKEPISLEDYLKKVTFKIDNYESVCKNYKDNSLYIEVEATRTDSSIEVYKIPLILEDNC